MGRRRRKVVRIPKRRLPKIFTCPRCGRTSIKIDLFESQGRAMIRCSSCDLRHEMDIKPTLKEIDVYSRFADEYYLKASS